MTGNVMETLAEKMLNRSDFLIGVELVSIRGSMSDDRAVKARQFGLELAADPSVDWVSITDNAGGNPQLAPAALGKPVQDAGKEVVIHLSCKDLNRNGLESQAWYLHGEGLHNILALTGDYPVSGLNGSAKPVFDIDSVGLITMLEQMNRGFDPRRKGSKAPLKPLRQTNFLIGAVTTNFKLREGEVMPQYLKLEKKVECGAQFIINQVGYDSRKMHELLLYMNAHGMRETPLIGNVYVLNARVAEIFHTQRIPGVVVSDALLDVCRERGKSEDKGRAFFLEMAARQVAIFRGLGYRGAYIGGVHSLGDVHRILEMEQSFAADDWKDFAREISYSRPGEFFYFGKDADTGLANPEAPVPGLERADESLKFSYRFSKWAHDSMFVPTSPVARWGARTCRQAKDPFQGPGWMRTVEHASKVVMFSCRDCGDCSLPDIGYLCPESRCAKNQRNGPCGGTRSGQCEVDGIGECIWLRAYERRKSDGSHLKLLEHAPVLQDQSLRRTSSWANQWLGRDHSNTPALLEGEEPAKPAKLSEKKK